MVVQEEEKKGCDSSGGMTGGNEIRVTVEELIDDRIITAPFPVVSAE